MSRKKGDELESKVAKDLDINKTTNSGAKWDNADLTNKDLIIECKIRIGKGLQACAADVRKLKAQALKHSKEWVYLQQSDDGMYAVLDYNFLLEILEKMKESKK